MDVERILGLLAIAGFVIALNWMRFSSRHAPSNDEIWHKWDTLFPVRLKNGKWSGEGQLWRRRGPRGGWEFKQDSLTPDEYDARIW